jgi:hypothetical protein
MSIRNVDQSLCPDPVKRSLPVLESGIKGVDNREVGLLLKQKTATWHFAAITAFSICEE